MAFAFRHQPVPARRFVGEWTTIRSLATKRARWQRLLDEAVEPNGFYGPDYLLASAEALEATDIRCLAIYSDGSPEAPLLGLFPLMRARLTDGALLPSWEFYRNEYICSSAPLVHRDDPVAICEGFLEAFADLAPSPRTLVAQFLPAARGGASVLRAALARRHCVEALVERHVRAAVETTSALPAYVAGLSSNRRKDIRRRERRLAEHGAVTILRCTGGDDRRAAFEDFLRVEASGWKATGGTALASHEATRQFAKRAFMGPGSSIDLLAVDGRAIAVCASLVAQGVQYTVKTAYDEAWRAFSPGHVLDLHLLENLCAGGALVRADSCALPGHHVEDIWREREPMDWTVFGLDSSVTQARANGLASTLRSVARLKTWVKDQIRAG